MLFKILNDFHILCNVIEDILNLDLVKKKYREKFMLLDAF